MKISEKMDFINHCIKFQLSNLHLFVKNNIFLFNSAAQQEEIIFLYSKFHNFCTSGHLH